MIKHLWTATLMTVVTTVLLGLVYPLVVTGLAQALFPDQANGQLVERDGKVVGSRLIAQPFTSPGYFRPRPSAAGHGYDAAASGGSNLGPTNKTLVDRVAADVARLQAEHLPEPPSTPPHLPAPPSTSQHPPEPLLIPIELVTTSASGLDPHLSPVGAEFQVPRVARERGVSAEAIRRIVAGFTEGRQLGVLGEPRVNVLLLNLALDEAFGR